MGTKVTLEGSSQNFRIYAGISYLDIGSIHGQMRADLYIRVSTDEQADKGYSQRDQEERLRKYCEIKSIEIRKVIFEDHSAKTFKRPEWSALLLDLKKKRTKLTWYYLLNGIGLAVTQVMLTR